MERVRLSADVDPELRRQVKVAAAMSDRSISDWVEHAVRRELEQESSPATDSGDDTGGDDETHDAYDAYDGEDRGWLESDLSGLGEIEPYEWQEGELEKGTPIDYEPEVGFVVRGGKGQDR